MLPEQLMTLRRADLKTSIVLIVLSSLMIIESFNFPLSDSYAGVTNAWYVSPALFPILIAIILLLCGIVLFLKALVFVKANAGTTPARESAESWGRFVLLVSLIAGQVYGWVPIVDFALAAFIFLFLFIFSFYADSVLIQKKTLVLWSTLSIIFIIISQIFTPSEEGRFLLDWVVVLVIGVILFMSKRWANQTDTNKAWRSSWKAALIVTVIVCPVFRLGMLVPLPTEGLVIEKMVDAKYVIRDMWRGK
ncbi:tripartite tricarboxylate transporter TctB family protein [Marinomonas sp. 2405UD68-3]|uniref:tripartite tricarboxylate transporter TctB family protein n=1 Tax=Marinomonas sp. 2405UD68-3 TaxID=3391835 RepID=UPI0039C8E8DF